MNLLTGQTVFLNAVAVEPTRYIAVEREVLRRLLAEDSSLADLLLATFVNRREGLQEEEGIGIEIVGPQKAPKETRRIVEWARRARIPHSWIDPEHSGERNRAAGRPHALTAHFRSFASPVERCSSARATARYRAPSGSASSGAARGGRPVGDRRRTGGPRCRGLRSLRGPRHPGDREHGARRPGGHLAADRELPRLPRGDQRHRADQPRRDAGAEVPAPWTATPYRALALEPGERPATWCGSRAATEISARAVVIATGADYRRLPVERLSRSTRASASSTPPARPRRISAAAQRVGVIGGGNSAAQAAIWLARGGALPILLHRRANLRETMSSYLIEDLERYGARRPRQQRGGGAARRETATSRPSRCSTATRLPLKFLFLFLGAVPCTDWLGDTVARDEKGFILTGPQAGAEGMLRRRACPASSPPATSAPARSSAARSRSARERRRCATSTSAARPRCPSDRDCRSPQRRRAATGTTPANRCRLTRPVGPAPGHRPARPPRAAAARPAPLRPARPAAAGRGRG